MEKQKKTKRKDTDLRMAWGFALFILCFAALLIVLTVRALEPKSPNTDDTSGTTTSSDGEQDPPEDLSKPVFSGGNVGTLPHKTDATATLGDALSSTYGVLVDAASGVILADKAGNTRFNPASMTKVMTLIVLCEQFTESDLDEQVIMREEMRRYVTSGAYQGAGCFGFIEGDQIKLKDLLYGIGVESDADCTMLAVQALFPDDAPAVAEGKAVALMNQRAVAMGLTNTHFDNVIGHESENNYTTAAEMAAIMAYALQSPLIKDILSEKNHRYHIYRLEDDGISYERWTMTYYSSLFNNARGEGVETSRIARYEKQYKTTFRLNAMTFGGGKTGTLGSGAENDPYSYSLVSFATSGDKLYIAVTGVLTQNGYDVMRDAKTLYDTYAK